MFRVFLLFLFTISLTIKAGKIDKAFEALEIYDYFKAKKLFYSQLTKKNQWLAAYGLSIIYYRNDNPFHNLDSAAKYITLSGNSFIHPKNELPNVAGFWVDSLSIRSLADSVASKAIFKIYLLNTTEAYEKFLLQHPFAGYKIRNEAFYLRDELVFKLNRTYNASDSTKLFIQRFPESYFLTDYQTLLDKQIYEEKTPDKTTHQLIHFIKSYPKNKNVANAQDALFEIYKKDADVNGLDQFVKNYPASRSINEAWKLLYALSVKSYNTQELQNFASKYPDFPFKNSINKEIELNARFLIPMNENDNVGFIDSTGKFSIPPIYEAATPFKEGLAVVIRNDSSFFINKENTNNFGTFYQEAYNFSAGKAPVNTGGDWFLINHQGQKVAGPFEEISEQGENIYIIKQNKKYGAIDVWGNLIIKPQFDKLGDFKNGCAYYLNNGIYGFVTTNGFVSPPRYQWISDFDEHKTAVVKLNNAYGLIDSGDKLLLDAKYDLIIKGKETVFILVKNNKYGFFSKSGCFITDTEYDYKKEQGPSYYTNGTVFKLIKKKQQALMDENGKIIVDFDKFEEVGFLQSGLIRVMKKKKYGYADKKLSIVIPFKYSMAGDFNDSLAICSLKQETLLINRSGEEIVKTKGSITSLGNNYYWMSEENGSSLLNKKGKILFTGLDSYQITNDFSGDGILRYLILLFQNNSRKVLKY